MAITIYKERVTEGSITVSIYGVQASDKYKSLSLRYRYIPNELYELAHGWTLPAGAQPAAYYQFTIGGVKGTLRPGTTYSIKVDEIEDSPISTTYTTARTSSAAGEISVDATPSSFTVNYSGYEGYKPYERIAEIGYRENNKYGPLVAREYITIPNEVPQSTISATFDTADISPGKKFYAYVDVWYKATTDPSGPYQSLGRDVSIPYANISYALVESYSYEPPRRTLTLRGSLYIYPETLDDTTIKLKGWRSGTYIYFGDIPKTEPTWEMEVEVSDVYGSVHKFEFYAESECRIDGELVGIYNSPSLKTDKLTRVFKAWDSFYGLPFSSRFSHTAWNDGIRFLQTAHEVFPDYFPDSYEIEEAAEGDPWLASDAMVIPWGDVSRYYVSYDRISLADIQNTIRRINRKVQQAIEAENGE